MPARDAAQWVMALWAGGILTGQFREVPTFGHGDMRASFYGPMFTEPGFSQIQTLLKVMDGIAETHKATVAQVAINWPLPMTTCTPSSPA